MGSLYEFNINPFQDFLFMTLMYGGEIADKSVEEDIYVGFTTILSHILNDENDARFLSYEIRKTKGHYKIIADNMVSALWLSGIFPKNLNFVNEKNRFVLDNIEYKFNPKTKKLTFQSIEKNG